MVCGEPRRGAPRGTAPPHTRDAPPSGTSDGPHPDRGSSAGTRRRHSLPQRVRLPLRDRLPGIYPRDMRATDRRPVGIPGVAGALPASPLTAAMAWACVDRARTRTAAQGPAFPQRPGLVAAVAAEVAEAARAGRARQPLRAPPQREDLVSASGQLPTKQIRLRAIEPRRATVERPHPRIAGLARGHVGQQHRRSSELRLRGNV